jgi:acyl-CoA thioesterase FadM
MTHLSTTHRSTVTEDQIDHLGHMNVRFYGVNARQGTEALLARLGASTDQGFRLVDVYTRHHREQLLGAPLAVRSGVVGAGTDHVRLYHELVNEDTGDLAATFVHRVVARTSAGRPGDVPDELVRLATAATIETPDHGATRSISLDADPMARPPSLPEVTKRDLAMRKVRAVPADECEADGRYVWDNAPALAWGGEPINRSDGAMLHDGPNGEKMGWASMETRMCILRLPRVGDRIQSFGATVEIRDKTTHVMLWAYDVDRGDLLTVFEVVSLAFDTVSRRAMSIPDAVRADEDRRFHPDLAAAT